MAEWRSRGFVPDSDEEEEDIGSGRCIQKHVGTGSTKPGLQISNTLSAPQEAVNKGGKEADEVAGEEVCEHSPKQLQSPQRKPGIQVRIDNGPDQSQNATKSTTSDGHGGISRVFENEGPSQKPGSALRDIDELQEGHYHSMPPARNMLTNTPSLRVDLNIDNPREPESPMNVQKSSFASSPLSLLSLSPTSDWLSNTMHVDIPSNKDECHKQQSQEQFSIDRLEPQLRMEIALESGNRTRQLRQRNLIQLHPYAVESEKYRQILKARGVKPLRIAQTESQAANDYQDDSQDVEFELNSRSQRRAANMLENLSSLSPLPAEDAGERLSLKQDPFQNFGYDDEDLPDIDTILRSRPLNAVSRGHKRQRIARKATEHLPMTSVQSQGIEEDARVMDLADDDVAIFDVPPSPPNSIPDMSQVPNARGSKGFKYPRGTSPPSLPTPVTSSEPAKKPRRLSMRDIELSQDASEETSESKASSSSDDSRANLHTRQLEKEQRKIRGVLPASWLRIDLKTQRRQSERNHERQETFPLEKRNSPVRGIARPVSPHDKSRSRSTAPSLPIELSDETDTDVELGDSASQSPLAQSSSSTDPELGLLNEALSPVNDRWDEVAEDNRIDAMLPPMSRTKFWPRNSRKRQAKLTDSNYGLSQSNQQHTFKDRQAQKRHQRATSNGMNLLRNMKPQFRPPRLSILDALDLENPACDSTPLFLRVASRTVKARNDLGRHSPRGKHFCLPPSANHIDPNNVLWSWRKGRLKSRVHTRRNQTSVRAPLRSPLGLRRDIYGASPCSHSLPISETDRTDYTKDQSPHPDRRPEYPRPSKVQSSLDHLIRRKRTHNGQQDLPKIKRVQSNSSCKKRKPQNSLPGQISSNVHEQTCFQPAMLEQSQKNFDHENSLGDFGRHLIHVGQEKPQQVVRNPLLRRFVDSDALSSSLLRDEKNLLPVENLQDGKRTKSIRRQARKRCPTRVDPSQSNLMQRAPLKLLDDDHNSGDDSEPNHRSTRPTLVRLGPYGMVYTHTFGISPFPIGTYFSERTLIGNGLLAESCQDYDLDRPRELCIVHFEQERYRWGPWNDAVSAQLGKMVNTINVQIQSLQKNLQESLDTNDHDIFSKLKSIVRYLISGISFLDPIDRASFLQRCKSLFISTVDILGDSLQGMETANLPQSSLKQIKRTMIKAATFNMILMGQLKLIANNSIVPEGLRSEIDLLAVTVAKRTAGLEPKQLFDEAAECFERYKQTHASESGIGDCYCSLEALIIIHLIITRGSLHNSFWEVANPLILPATADLNDVQTLETSWQRLFTLLPHLEIGNKGVLDFERRHKIPTENWSLVKQLITPVLQSFKSSNQRQPSTINTYCRALFSRCLELINNWGWAKGELIIGTLFDFFSSRNYEHLPKEETNGSPLFLEKLHHHPSLEVSPEDRCFHIFLKLVGSGLHHLRRVYPEKKIRDIIWRLTPNHDRFLSKEQSVRQEDLDAVRNHHELLCTLYWVSPQGARPKISSVQNLVNLETSHKEACRISVKAWSNLIQFQLSANEPLHNIGPFMRWYNAMLMQLLGQHRAARVEAEDQVKLVESVKGYVFSKSLLESMITKNQRQIQAILSDSLLAMMHAMDAAPDIGVAKAIFAPELASVFSVFQPGPPPVNKILIQTLDIVLAFTSKALPQQQQKLSNCNDDSQDWGDWSFLEDEAGSLLAGSGVAAYLQENFLDALRQLLSNCFGADTAPEDTLLVKVIDAWIAVARILVLEGSKSWVDYVGRYGPDSWTSLRDTEQRRKFYAYYLAALIKAEKEVYIDHQQALLEAWIASLVERESLLKFQHKLTNTLLNIGGDDPVLQNPPFCRVCGHFEIGQAEFLERRILLVSNILSNMRLSVDDSVYRHADYLDHKTRYKAILKVMMSTMKNNYMELGQGATVRGAYVDFVHKIVELLQQYTSTICPVDRFFTDSNTFPLPATDPTYVVGQLKHYGLRLQDSKTPKQLAVFIQSVSERAAIDGQQPYLGDQLYSAMSDTSESGDPTNPSLRTFLIQEVFPVYFELAFSTSCGWLWVLPILQALQMDFLRLMENIDGLNPANVDATLSSTSTFLCCLWRSFELLIDHPGLIEQPKVIKTLAACYAAITAVLPAYDYLNTLRKGDRRRIQLIASFKAFALFAASLLLGYEDVRSPESEVGEDHSGVNTHSDVRKFALDGLKDTLSKNWICRDEQYYVNTGQTRREVVVDVGSFEEEKTALMCEIEGFVNLLRRMTVLGGNEHTTSMVRGAGSVEMDDLWF